VSRPVFAKPKEIEVETAQGFYSGHGAITSPGTSADAFRALPRDVASLCKVIQGVLIHRDIAPWLYELRLSEEQRDAANLRSMREMIAAIVNRDARPIGEARQPGSRLPCVCRHFAAMLCAILREQGVPARARCGFGAYFIPGRFEDHWVAEYWNDSQQRWILVDAQLDAIQRKAFRIEIDPLDLPRDQFIVAADAWQMCREGRADPGLFGLSILNEAGLWWVAQNLIRDLASLNRIEMLPWDVWGIMPEPADELSADEIALLDRVAELIVAGDAMLPGLRAIYDDARLQLPPVIFNANRQQQETISF
jgi:hypothetical protein